MVIDGGLSTALAELGLDLDHPLWTARALLDPAPDAEHPVTAAHLAFLRAGARVLITSSYQASRHGLRAAGAPDDATADRLLARTTALARAAVARFAGERPDVAATVRVGASVGPYGAVLADGSEYRGNYAVDHTDLVAFHRERLAVLAASGPDLLVVETLPGPFEALAIADASSQLSRPLPAWVSFTFADAAHTADGSPLDEAADAAARVPDVEAVGVNCTAPHHVAAIVHRLHERTGLPVVAYPNLGQRWDPATNEWRGHDADWPPDDVASWAASGARWIGGCCGVGPAGVSALSRALVGG